MDLISRQAAIDAVADLYWMDERLLNFKKEIDATFDKIKALPSAQPEPRPKRGKWETEVRTIRGHKIPFFACSVCGRNADGEYPYCPNCGAKMDDDWEEPEINPCRGCGDYDGRGGCKSRGGCGAERSEE